MNVRFCQRHEIRIADGESGPVLTGMAAPFGIEADIGGWFVERIKRGAFKKTIQEADVRALINHDSSLVLGRTSSSLNPLKLREDKEGLQYEVPLNAAVSYVADFIENARAGNFTGNSFQFDVVNDRRWMEGEVEHRELLEVRLYDVGPVQFPAYQQTHLALRSEMRSALESTVDFEAVEMICAMSKRGRKLRDVDVQLLNDAVELVKSCQGPGPEPHPEAVEEPGDHSFAVIDAGIRKQLIDCEIGGLR